MASSSESTLTETLEVLLRFGGQLLGAGHAAYRVRRFVEDLGRRMEVDALALQLGLSSIVATGRRGAETATVVREVGFPGVNTSRIRALEKVVSAAPQGLEPSALDEKLEQIEHQPPRH